MATTTGDSKLPVLPAESPVTRQEVAARLGTHSGAKRRAGASRRSRSEQGGQGRAGFLLVDVLSVESYASVHIRGALSLPLAELPDRAAEVLPDRAAEIVVYCGGFT